MAGPDTLGTLINIVSVLMGGTALGVVLNYRHKMRELQIKERTSDGEAERVNFETILSEMRKQRDEAWAKVLESDHRIKKLEDEITGLRIARDLDPFPHWIVGSEDYSYLYVNREFEKWFLSPDGKTYRDIIGQKHEDFWPPEFCRTLYALNDAAKSRPDGTARAVTSLTFPRIGRAQVTVHKFPVKAQPSGVIIAWAGYITGIEPEVERTIG